jgi:hypothetical protein
MACASDGSRLPSNRQALQGGIARRRRLTARPLKLRAPPDEEPRALERLPMRAAPVRLVQLVQLVERARVAVAALARPRPSGARANHLTAPRIMTQTCADTSRMLERET